jgi:hypothetical protein
VKKNLAMYITALALLAVLVLPVRLAAQDKQDHHDTRHHYQLIDIGTLGGPNSYLPALPPYREFLPSASLSQNGTFAGFADTATLERLTKPLFEKDRDSSHALGSVLS